MRDLGSEGEAPARPRDLVVCSLEAWNEVWRRNQHLIAGLLASDRRLRVLFVEPETDPLHALTQRRRPQRPAGLRHRPDVAGGRLWTYEQLKLAPRQLGPVADAMLAAGVRVAARRLGMRAPLLWVNDPARAPLVTGSGWAALYDITDDWLVADRAPRERARLMANEAQLMSRCAAVVVCSPHLAAVKGRVRPVELIPNAVDVERYRRPAPRPPDLPSGPTAVYVGTLHEDRLDVALCIATARALGARGRLVLVGPNALSTVNTAALAGEPNIDLLGARPFDAIPGYLQHATTLVTPHVITEFTESLDPIKLYEYLAVGPPVVTTPVAGFRDRPGDVVLADADAFPAAVLGVLSGATPAPRPPLELPTWQDRVAQYQDVLDRVDATRAR